MPNAYRVRIKISIRFFSLLRLLDSLIGLVKYCWSCRIMAFSFLFLIRDNDLCLVFLLPNYYVRNLNDPTLIDDHLLQVMWALLFS